MSGKRPEFVAWDAGVQDGLRMARIEAFGAIRRAAALARRCERDASTRANIRNASMDLECADAIRIAIREALNAETIR